MYSQHSRSQTASTKDEGGLNDAQNACDRRSANNHAQCTYACTPGFEKTKVPRVQEEATFHELTQGNDKSGACPNQKQQHIDKCFKTLTDGWKLLALHVHCL